MGGEGLWSKSQKNAAISLERYGNTKDEADFQAFLTYMQVPKATTWPVSSCSSGRPTWRSSGPASLRGHIDPADIDPMIDLLRRFHWVSYLSRAISIWSAADDMLGEFKAAGLAYRGAIAQGDRTAAVHSMADLKHLNERLTPLEDEFSYVLGVGSRWIEHVVLTLLSLAVLAVESIGLTLTFLTSRSISRGLRELNQAAVRIGSGDFATTLAPRSRDERSGSSRARSARWGSCSIARTPSSRCGVNERTAELARSRDALGFLDEASQVLASSLTYKETLRQVAALAVPRLADGCVIELGDQGAGPWSVAVGRARRVRASETGGRRDRRQRDKGAGRKGAAAGGTR